MENQFELFWEWFSSRESELFEIAEGDEPVLDELKDQLSEVHRGLTFEIGPERDGRRGMVVSAGGRSQAFPVVKQLLASCPKMDRWVFVAFKPRRSKILDVDLGALKVTAAETRVRILRNRKDSSLGLMVFMKGFTEERRPEFRRAALLMAEQALGERDLGTYIRVLELADPDSAQPTKTFPITELASQFDAALADRGVDGLLVKKTELVLRACERRLAKRRRWGWLPGVWGKWVRRTPGWAKQDDLGRVFHSQKELLRKGRIVCGCIVQANRELFKTGPTSWPGEVVFSVGEEQHPKRLFKLSKALFSLRGTQPADPEAKAVAEHLESGKNRVFGLNVPKTVDPDGCYRLSTVMVFRSHLPDAKLSNDVMPLLVLESSDRVAMILPSEFWPRVLRREWGMPEPRLSFGLLFAYKILALIYFAVGAFLGSLLRTTADGKLVEYVKEHPLGTLMILLANALGLLCLKALKSNAEDLPELRTEHLKKLKWYQLGGIPMTDRVAFLLWFVAYLIGLILGIVFGP